MRDASQLADSFLSASLHILAERISDGGLTPTTDTNLLLATYRSGSHLTSDIYFIIILYAVQSYQLLRRKKEYTVSATF